MTEDGIEQGGSEGVVEASQGDSIAVVAVPEAESAPEVTPPEEVPQISDAELPAVIEALLFASGEPISSDRIGECVDAGEAAVRSALEILRQRYLGQEFGVELVEVAEKFQFRTKEPFGPWIRRLKAGRPRKLSAAALETVAIVAYRQPIVKSDIEKIRGVDATPTLKTLIDRGLIRIVGHQATVGQPALYGTTEEFLKLFGLRSLGELPTLRDLKEFEQEPGEEPAETIVESAPAEAQATPPA